MIETWFNSGAGTAIAVPFQAVAVEASIDMETLSNPTPTSVYKYYDVAGLLLYVGITKTGMQRNRQHNADKEWWRWVVTQEVEHFPSGVEAHVREVALIRKFRPPFNTQHNYDYFDIRAAYRAARHVGVYELPTVGSLRREWTKFEVAAWPVDGDVNHIDFITRLEHWPAVSRLTFTTAVRLVTLEGHRMGFVASIDRHGPVARIRCSLKNGWTCKSARIDLKPLDKKQTQYQIKRLMALDAVCDMPSEQSA